MSPDKIDATLKQIRKLGLPSRRYAELLIDREHQAALAEKRHKELGRLIVAHVVERFRRGLCMGKRRVTVEAQTYGYSINWSRDASGRSAVPEPVQPYIHLRVFIYEADRCEIDVNYWPRDAAGLKAWCDRWIAWLKAAPTTAEYVAR